MLFGISERGEGCWEVVSEMQVDGTAEFWCCAWIGIKNYRCDPPKTVTTCRCAGTTRSCVIQLKRNTLEWVTLPELLDFQVYNCLETSDSGRKILRHILSRVNKTEQTKWILGECIRCTTKTLQYTKERKSWQLPVLYADAGAGKKKTFDTFLTELLVNNHRFAGLKDSLIRDRVICEIHETNLWRQPLRETELTLQECICTCRASELFGTDRNVGQTLQRVKMTKSEYSRDKSTSQH